MIQVRIMFLIDVIFIAVDSKAHIFFINVKGEHSAFWGSYSIFEAKHDS